MTVPWEAHGYDALDRVLTSTFPSDSAENVTYTYDQSGHGAGSGRLTSVSDAAGTLSRSYDQLGNLLTDARTAGTVNLTTTYTYDTANRIASITYPSGAVVSYARDSMGHVTSVSAQPSGGTSTPVVSSVAYKPFGPYSGLTYGNAVAETRDQDYRLTGVTDTATFALQNLGYAYYPTNHVQTITDAVNSGNSKSFSYDSLLRLSSAAGGYGTFGYTYDLDGNRLSQTHGIETTNYGYGSGSDLLATLSVGGLQTQAIGYTADGRIASLSPGIQVPGGPTITSLSYNQDARLASVNATGGALASYTYDGFGQRLIKTVSGSYGEIYQYGQNGMVLEAASASGVAQVDYIYLDGRPVATLNPSTGALNFLHDDMLGTPQLATDGSQTVAWQATYEPFGQASVSGTIAQNLRFPGQYFDVESGWNHNGFRNYLPDLGRYMEPDPLGRLGSGNNLHAYAADNPISYLDPSGLSNQNLFNPSTDPELYSAANDWNPSGVYSVAGHGDVYENGDSAGTLAGLTPQQLAQLIQKDPNWKKQPTILRSCRTGQGGAKSFAQQLANILGVQVTAPINDATWWMFPNFFTGNEISLGTTGGNYQPFSPMRK